MNKATLIPILVLIGVGYFGFGHYYGKALADTKASTFTVSVTVVSNPKAGKAIFDGNCIECHEASDFSDTSVGEIKGVVDGTTKHKKDINLTQKQIEDLVSYLQTTF